jgi:hypothetical protein
MAKYAYLNTQPAEVTFNEPDIYIKYESGSDKLLIGDNYYKIESLEKMIEILRDIISLSKMNENE